MKLQLPKSATEQTVNLFVQSPTATDGSGATGLTATTSGLQMFYVRPKAAAVAVTLATGAATGAYTSGLLAEISATGMKGWYRFDPPDAALASGVDHVGFHLSGASSIAPLPFEIQLTSLNLNDGVNAGLTALPTATIGATGGLARRTDLLTATSLNSATNLTGLATITATDVLTQAKQGLQDYNLHKWIATAATATDVVDGSLLARIASSATAASFSGFVNTTDSLQAIRDRGDAAWITAAGFATHTATDVRTQALGALDDRKLDKLISAAATATDVAGNSIIARLVSKTAATATAEFSSYDNTTDSLEALRDRGDTAWKTATGYSTLTATDVLTQAFDALNTAAPGSPTANSVHDTLVDLAAVLPTTQLASFLTANGLETGFTVQQGLRLMAAVLLGKLSGATTATQVFRDINDAVNRVSAVVDQVGNRTSLSYIAT